MAIADSIEHETVLIAKTMFLLLVGKAACNLVTVRSGSFADTTAAHEYLGLQQKFAFARLALHVIDGVPLLDVGIKAEDHGMRSP